LIAAAVVDEDDFEIADGAQDRLKALHERDECRLAVIDGNDDGYALDFLVHAELLPKYRRSAGATISTAAAARSQRGL
jgi:hypothetical protein